MGRCVNLLPGRECLTEVASVGQLLIQLSSRGEFQNNIDSILIPKVTIHAKDILLPAEGESEESEEVVRNGSIVGNRRRKLVCTSSATESQFLCEADAQRPP